MKEKKVVREERNKEKLTSGDWVMAEFYSIHSLKSSRIIRKSKFPPNPERSVQFSGKRTKRSVQKKGCTQHL